MDASLALVSPPGPRTDRPIGRGDAAGTGARPGPPGTFARVLTDATASDPAVLPEPQDAATLQRPDDTERPTPVEPLDGAAPRDLPATDTALAHWMMQLLPPTPPVATGMGMGRNAAAGAVACTEPDAQGITSEAPKGGAAVSAGFSHAGVTVDGGLAAPVDPLARRGAFPVSEAPREAQPSAPMPVPGPSREALASPEPGSRHRATAADLLPADLPVFQPVAAPTGSVPTVVMPAGSPAPAPAQTWIQTPVTQPGFANEVVTTLVRDVSQSGPGQHALTLHLNPESLGPVSVAIELQGSAARIVFSASEALTRQHLEAALPELGQAFLDQGLSLAHAGVHEASKESLAASAAGGTAYGGGGPDGRQPRDPPFDGRFAYGERSPRRETSGFSVEGGSAAALHPSDTGGAFPRRAGRLDLFA